MRAKTILGEDRVKDAILNFINRENFLFEAVRGDEPPDYYLREVLSSQQIALEITRGNVDTAYGTTRQTTTFSLIDFINELEREFGKLVPEQFSIFIYLRGPINNYYSYKKQVKESLKQFLESKEESARFSAEQDNFEMAKTSKRSRKIVGGVGHSGIGYNIEETVNGILNNIIQNKKKKCEKINCKKWLGIENWFFLAEVEDYKKIATSIVDRGGFERIFVLVDQQLLEI